MMFTKMCFIKVTSWLILIGCIVVQNRAAAADTKDSPISFNEHKKLGKEVYASDVDLTILQTYQMQVKSNVNNHFAHTTIVSKVKNLADRAQKANFSVVLPERAFIFDLVMEVNGKNYTGYVKDKEENEKTYHQAAANGFGAAHIVVSARDFNYFTVFVNMEPESNATFYLSYKELLEKKDENYELIINLHSKQPVKDLTVEINITEDKGIANLRTPHIRIGDDMGANGYELDPRATVELVDDTSAIVRFSPNVELEKQLLGTKEEADLAGYFVVQYDVKANSQGDSVIKLPFPTVQESFRSNNEDVQDYLTIKQLFLKRNISDELQERMKKAAYDFALKRSYVTPVTSLVVLKPHAAGAVNTKTTEKKQSEGEVPEMKTATVYSGGRPATRIPYPYMPRIG